DSEEGPRTAVHIGDDVVEAGGCSAGSGRRVEDLSTFEVERRVLCQPQVLAGPFHVLHDPERAAHDPLVGRGPGGADTRLEATIEGIKERPAVAVLPREEQLPGLEVDVGLP